MAPNKEQSKLAKLATDMQIRTRQERHFDDVERDLPSPKVGGPPALLSSVATLSASTVLSHLGRLNPLGKPVTAKDVVWLFDNTAFRPSRLGSWQAEFVAAVFEQDPHCEVASVVSGIASKLGLADDAAERRTIEERLLPFLWDIRPARIIRAVQDGRELKLGPTGSNGVSSEVLKIASAETGSIVPTEAAVPRGVVGQLDMQTVYAGPEGWSVISDIDDTIKVTMTSDPLGILRETFVNTPKPVGGMPELYAELKAMLPPDSPWFYLSASPYNLYTFLRDFRDRYYPPGTIILRDASWKTIAGLLSSLTMGTEEYKVDRMKKVQGWLPKRKLICIGDSTQSDPEAYGEIYRTFPGWVKIILIRRVDDIAAVGIQEKNEPARFEKAFEGVPREAWHVFRDPAECSRLVQDVLQRG